MDKLIDAFCKWEPLGQGIFLFLMAILLMAATINIFKFVVVLFRGWPPCEDCCDEDDDCCDEKNHCGKKGKA
jgi:hypothetical protein